MSANVDRKKINISCVKDVLMKLKEWKRNMPNSFADSNKKNVCFCFEI